MSKFATTPPTPAAGLQPDMRKAGWLGECSALSNSINFSRPNHDLEYMHKLGSQNLHQDDIEQAVGFRLFSPLAQVHLDPPLLIFVDAHFRRIQHELWLLIRWINDRQRQIQRLIRILDVEEVFVERALLIRQFNKPATFSAADILRIDQQPRS